MIRTDYLFCKNALTSKIVLGLLTLSLFCPDLVFSGGEVRPDDMLGCHFQFLTFKDYDSKKTYLEVYANIPTKNLTFLENKNSYEADYSITVNVYDKMGLFVDAKHSRNSIKLASLNELPSLGAHILRFDFLTTSGEHKIVVYVTDLKNLNNYAFNQKIDIPDYRGLQPQLSDLQLSLSITRSNGESSFTKQNWVVIPNVSKVYDHDFKTLYFYAELYNFIDPLLDSNVGLKSVLSIKDLDGNILKSFNSPNLKFGSNNILVGQIPLHELGGGYYELSLDVTDLDSGHRVEKSTRFAVIGPSS